MEALQRTIWGLPLCLAPSHPSSPLALVVFGRMTLEACERVIQEKGRMWEMATTTTTMMVRMEIVIEACLSRQSSSYD